MVNTSPGVPSERTTYLIIAAVGVLVLAAAAASLANPVPVTGSEGPPDRVFSGPDGDSENGDVGGVGEGDMIFGIGDQSDFGFCVEPLLDQQVQTILILAFVAIGLLIWWYTHFVFAIGYYGISGLLGVFAFVILTSGCESEEQEQVMEEQNETESLFEALTGEGGGAVGQVMDVATDPVVLFGALVIIGLLAFAFVIVTDDEEEPTEEETEEPAVVEPDIDPEVLARIAGEAADRIEQDASDAGLDNEVYRAWQDMTDHLDVDARETFTPGEFARRAIAAGMDSDDVMELTGLFEEVRYGDRPPTAERERRAVDTLRRIERTYGDGGADA